MKLQAGWILQFLDIGGEDIDEGFNIMRMSGMKEFQDYRMRGDLLGEEGRS